MPRFRPLRLALVLGVLSLGLNIAPSAAAPILHNRCTDPDMAFDATCVVPDGSFGHLLRLVCYLVWVEPLCAPTRFPDPGYRATTDPTPWQPLVQRVGAVHEHSGYSDGDPAMAPRDYYKAARTGHNTADSGGDTGVRLDFMFSSEHSDNAEIPITTAEACLQPAYLLACAHLTENDHYWKWPAALRQAMEATDPSFTAVRGFEWTNDYFNHMNVYFSTNFRNVKTDGSYLSMNVMWDWLRKPVDRGGGADALLTFNHPGGWPALTPFDGDLPHNQLLATLPGGSNWNDMAYVPDVDARVAGIEVNGGDDIEWYVKGLARGWHIGPVAAEDEHQREWATSADGKTLILTRGTAPADYYFAFQNHRTMAVNERLVNGAPGQKAIVPTMYFYADGANVQDAAATVLGGTIKAPGSHTLRFDATGLPPGSRLAMVSNTTGAQAAPTQLGAADADGTAAVGVVRNSPATDESWYFVVVCPADAGTECGRNQNYLAVTAPIWLRSS